MPVFVPSHNGALWPRSPPWQRRRPPHLCHAANWLFPKCAAQRQAVRGAAPAAGAPGAAQGGVSGHGFTGGKAQEFLQGQGIASCAGRCQAQSRCPETADHEHAERAARRDGPAARFFGGEGSTELFGEGVKFFHAGAVAAAGTRPAPDSGAVDRTKATGSSAVPASSQDAWPPRPSTTFDRLGTIMPCLETLQRAGTTAGGTQAVALIGDVTAERLLADRDMTPMRFLSRRQDRACRRSLCPKAGVQSGVVRTKSLIPISHH